ncbi:MAG: response regulator [Opitutus sp.]|nr:response regulator [Opitutus sp.]
MSLPAPDLPAASASNVSTELPEVLLIDDEVPFRELIAHFLRTRGYRVHEAGDGEQALRFLSGHPVGLIVSDVCMPNCDGIELLTELRRRRPTCGIIMMSGGMAGRAMSGGPALFLKMAQALGAHYTIAKPFPLDELLELIRKASAGPRGA